MEGVDEVCRYVKVCPKFWTDDKVQPLSDDARLLFLYLMTSPHSNMAGFYWLPLGYIAEDLRWDFERVEMAFAELCTDETRIWYDAKSRVVLIRNYLRYNPWGNVNHAKGACRKLGELPDTELWPTFLQCVEEHCPQHVDIITSEFPERFPDVPKRKKTEEVKPDNAAQQVMEHYNTVFDGLWARPLKLTKERRKKINARLETFTVEELCLAIDNIRQSDWHTGKDPKTEGKVFATPEFIFRNDAQVDTWMNRTTKKASAGRYIPGPEE